MEDSKKSGRRSMGGGLEEGVSSREVITDKTLRDEDKKSQAPKSSSESVGDGMTIKQQSQRKGLPRWQAFFSIQFGDMNMTEDPKYSHRSNGNCKCQNCRTGGGSHSQNIRMNNESTGNASTQDLLEEGVSSREPFDRQLDDFDDYGIYPW